jgi:hypothetical protein
MQPRLGIDNGHLARLVDPSFSQQQPRELENAINHYCCQAHRGYGEHFDAQSSYHRLVLGCAPYNRQIDRGARQRSKNRRASCQSRTDIPVHCHRGGRGRRARTADESSEYSSRKHALTAKSSGEQSPSNLNCDKQRPKPRHFWKRDGRCKLQDSWDGLFDYAITPHPQSRNQSHRQSGIRFALRDLGEKDLSCHITSSNSSISYFSANCSQGQRIVVSVTSAARHQAGNRGSNRSKELSKINVSAWSVRLRTTRPLP